VSLGWAPPSPDRREAGSSPGFTESPFVSMSRASDPGDPDHTSHTGVPDAAFRSENGVGIAIRPISGLNHRDLLTHCVRFAPASHPTNGNTRCRPARYGFDRAGLAPAGLHQEVSLSHRSSPSSALTPARSLTGHNRTVVASSQLARERPLNSQDGPCHHGPAIVKGCGDQRAMDGGCPITDRPYRAARKPDG
jgi:hypothetical protein